MCKKEIMLHVKLTSVVRWRTSHWLFVCMSVGHSVLGHLLRNSLCYYQQFLLTVLSHSGKLTAPVEKEFKVH